MDKCFISADSLLRDSFELGLRVLRSGFRCTFLAGIWRGGAPIGIAVQEVLDYHGVPTDHVAIRTSAYPGTQRTPGRVRVHALDYLVSRLRARDALLLVDDVFDSGHSLEAVIQELRTRCGQNMPREVRIATVYYRPARNRVGFQPDFYLHETDQWLVFPHELHGLSREEILAYKPLDEHFFEPR